MQQQGIGSAGHRSATRVQAAALVAHQCMPCQVVPLHVAVAAASAATIPASGTAAAHRTSFSSMHRSSHRAGTLCTQRCDSAACTARGLPACVQHRQAWRGGLPLQAFANVGERSLISHTGLLYGLPFALLQQRGELAPLVRTRAQCQPRVACTCEHCLQLPSRLRSASADERMVCSMQQSS